MAPKGKHQQPGKLRRLPKNARIQKRPLMHPPIASPYSGRREPKVVYVSSKTPFISAVKRVRKFLQQVEKRAMGKVDLLGPGKDAAKIAQTGRQEKGEPEEILIRATGRAIEKTLNLGIFFQGQEDCRVRVRTSTVATVDDIVEAEEPTTAPLKKEDDGDVQVQEPAAASQDKEKGDDVEMAEIDTEAQVQNEDDNQKESPDARIRMMSMVEIAVSLR